MKEINPTETQQKPNENHTGLRKTDSLSIIEKKTLGQVPNVPSAEIAALSIILQNYDALDAAKWDSDLFLNPCYRVLLATAKEAHQLGHKADLFRLQTMLEHKAKIDDAGGYHTLTEIYTAYPCGDVAIALEFRKDLLKARKYRKALQKIADSNEDIRNMRADLAGIAEHLTQGDEDSAAHPTMRDHCMALLNELERTEPKEKFKTGVAGLDRLLGGGFERGTVAVFSSETSGGKSIALLQTALQSALNEKAGLIFSLEMSVIQVLARLVASRTGWKCVGVSEKPSQIHVNAMQRGIGEISKLPIQIFDQIQDIDAIESICKLSKKNGAGLDWIVVDYIQLCSPSADSKSETREQQISEVVRRLKLLALQNNIAVFTASQLNDKGELRESRGIGHHADYVLMIDHSNHPESEIRVCKNRNGERHVSAPVVMQGAISRFADREGKK